MRHVRKIGDAKSDDISDGVVLYAPKIQIGVVGLLCAEKPDGVSFCAV